MRLPDDRRKLTHLLALHPINHPTLAQSKPVIVFNKIQEPFLISLARRYQVQPIEAIIELILDNLQRMRNTWGTLDKRKFENKGKCWERSSLKRTCHCLITISEDHAGPTYAMPTLMANSFFSAS